MLAGNGRALGLSALLLLAALCSAADDICDCEEKPKCPKEAPKNCGGGRGHLLVPGGEDCSCCEAVCPRQKGESCEGPHSLSCDHGLFCGEAGVCTDESSVSSGIQLTALSATETTLTLGWRGPAGYVIQYREVADGDRTPGPWERFEKLTETPEWNLTIAELKSGRSYEARALLPGADDDQGRLEGEPGDAVAVRAEVGCDCPRPFFRIGSVKGDSGCAERPMAEKPCCVLVVCADSQTSQAVQPQPSPKVLANATAAAANATTPAPTNSTEKAKTPASSCKHNNETRSVGEVFNDSCEHKCTCEEGGKVTCKPRCKEMPHNISSKCVTLPDPEDVCCMIVLCDVTLGEQETNPTVQAESSSKGSSDAALTTTPRSIHHDSKDGCTHNGHTYAIGQEFHDGCTALCVCSHDGEVECAPIQCPTDSGLDVLDPHCVTWEPVPMEPAESEGETPTCCPEVRCKDNGSCAYGGQHFDNFAEIPASVADGCSGHRCFCEFGNITCGGGRGPTKCPPVPAHAPTTLECREGMEAAVLAHPPGDNCCLAWVCPENAHLPPISHHDKGNTNSSAEGPVPEIMMIPQVDNVTVSTDKSRPMTEKNTNSTHTGNDDSESVMKMNMTKDSIENSTDATNKPNSTSSGPSQSTIVSTMIGVLHGIVSQSSPPESHDKAHGESENDQSTILPTTPSHMNMTTNEPHTSTISIQEISSTETTPQPTTMRPIIVQEKPAYQSPWGSIAHKPEVRTQPKHPQIPGPVQVPDVEEDPYSYWYGSAHNESPKNDSTVEIPFAPEYHGPFAPKPETPVMGPFNSINDEGHQMPPINQQKPHENSQKKPQQVDDNLPIFLRYPVQSGKKQKVDPQKSRLPDRPFSPNANEFTYKGPFLRIPPSDPGEQVLFHPQDGATKPTGNFSPNRPASGNVNKKDGHHQQQTPPLRQPSSNKYPAEPDRYSVPLLIHPGQRVPPSGPPNIPPHFQGPVNQGAISGNTVQHPQSQSPPSEHYQIQDLEGGPVPPEIAQHILWALQGRHPTTGDPRQQQQGHRIHAPPPRGQGLGMPQEVFFHVPTAPGPGNHPIPPPHQGIFIQSQEPTNYRTPQRVTPHHAVVNPNIRGPQPRPAPPPHGPPHFLPGVEPEFLPPELYHLAFSDEHPDNKTKQETNLPSKTNAQPPHTTQDRAHLTEDLPPNHPGTDYGRPPPPPRFPDVPLHPQLHPQLHNVGVSSASDEIVVEAANVQPDSSVHLVFSLPSLFVGLHGQVEISYTQDPLKEDPGTWEGKEVVSTPDDLIGTRRLEYTIPAFNGKTGLQPNTVYRIRIVLLLRDLRNSPSSRIITIQTPSGHQVTTTQLPAQIEADAELGIAEVNATWARFVWRKFNDFELQFIDGVQLRYKEIEGKVYSTTQLLHRATGSYTLEGLRPSSTYEVGLLLVPFPGQKTELIARETLHITTAAEKDPYGFDLKIKVDAVKVFSAEVSWSGVPYPEDKYVNIFRVIYQSDSAGTKGGEGSEGGADGEERSSTFKVAKRDPSPSALVTGLKPGTRYRMWLEAYLTNGRIKKSDVKDIVTKPSSSSTKQGKLEASVGEVGKKSTEESGDYYGGLVGVSILAALAFVAILVLLLMLLKRQGQAKKAAISSARKSESAYDNPTYKTSDHDSTNGRIKNSPRLQEA